MKRIQPSVVIGLGGTGVNTITFLKRTLLEQAPDIARFVRFLAIDIDELKGEVPSGRLFGEPVRLDANRNEFLRIADQTTGNEARNIPAVASWFPEHAYRYLPLTEGARQAKPIGRLGFFLAHDIIARRLLELCAQLVTPDVLQQFPGLRTGAVNIYIVASICGGTGAGLFVDTAYELRYLHQQAHLPQKTRIKGLFALGDVYDAISKRVLANTYASLREINWIQRENTSFRPIYPSVARDAIKDRPFDAVYLFSDRNGSDIQFSSPIDFAQLCADFIFLDSGADARDDGGDALSQVVQSARNNAEVYTMNFDADGVPRCYSSLGLCKIRFPAHRVAELCAARMSLEVINHHLLGSLSTPEVLEARRKSQEFLAVEALTCDQNSSQLPDRLIHRLEGGDRLTLDRWIIQSLNRAQTNDLENMKQVDAGRFANIDRALQTELQRMQEDMPGRVVSELVIFRRVLDAAVARMFKENLGVSFVSGFLDELLAVARASRDYAQETLKQALGREKTYGDQMSTSIREMANLSGGGILDWLRGEARREQLKTAYKAIRANYLNKVQILKMRAAITFYDGVYDSHQRLMEGGEGALSILSNMVNGITLIQAFVRNLKRTFEEACEDGKLILPSPFEILIIDKEGWTELEEVYGAVYSDALRAALFETILGRIGGSIWDLRNLIDKAGADTRVRGYFLDACMPPFMDEADKKTVAQRILDAKRRSKRGKDYGPHIQAAYELANTFCRMSEAAARFADLRPTEQMVACVVGYHEDEDPAWQETEKLLRESMGRAGQRLPIAHSADRHSILIYREYAGFPAYALRRVDAYAASYNDEARRDNVPPLQMLTAMNLPHIHVPTRPVLSKYEILTMEAIAFGLIVAEQSGYFLLTLDEWRRRKRAEEAQRSGSAGSVADKKAGSHRRLGSSLAQVHGRLREAMPETERLASGPLKFELQIRTELESRKSGLPRDLHFALLRSLYFEGFAGSEHEQLDIEQFIRPPAAFIIDRDFAVKPEDLRRPDRSHAALLEAIYFESQEPS